MSTNQRAPKKHRVAIQVRVKNVRKRSEEEIEESNRKKERIHSSSPEEEAPEIMTGNLTGTLDLADPQVIQRLSDIYKNATMDCLKEATKEMTSKIEDLEISVVNHDQRFENVEQKIDDLEQKEKNKNIIIRGVPAGTDTLQKSLELINKELKFTLRRQDVKFAVRIGKVQSEEDKPVRVAFEEQKNRDRVYQNRIKITNRNVWISEDLTLRRSELAFRARKAVCEKLAIKTWTYGGNVFLKISETGKPKKINTFDDLPYALSTNQAEQT